MSGGGGDDKAIRGRGNVSTPSNNPGAAKDASTSAIPRSSALSAGHGNGNAGIPPLQSTTVTTSSSSAQAYSPSVSKPALLGDHSVSTSLPPTFRCNGNNDSSLALREPTAPAPSTTAASALVLAPSATVAVSQAPPAPSHSPRFAPPDVITATTATTTSLFPPVPSHSHSQSPASSASPTFTSPNPPTLHPPSDSPPPQPTPNLPHELIDAILRTALLIPPATPTTHPSTHIQTYLLVIGDLSTPTNQCAMLGLPHASSMDTAAGLGRTDVLTKRVQLGLPIDPSAYSAVAIDIACELGHVHVLDWFEKHKLPLVRSSIALMSASLRAHIDVLEWWKARDSPALVDHPHSLASVAGYSVWVASRVGEMRSVRWWTQYAQSVGDAAVRDRVLVDVLDASLHAATFFGHVHVLEYWARRWARWARHLVDPSVDSEWGARVPAFAKLEEAAAAAAASVAATTDGAHVDAQQGQQQPTFMVRWWLRLLGQVGDNEYYFRSAHSQARKELVRGMQWWVHRAAVVREGEEAPLATDAALEHLKRACLRFAPAKVLRRVMREPKQGVLDVGVDGDVDGVGM